MADLGNLIIHFVTSTEGATKPLDFLKNKFKEITGISAGTATGIALVGTAVLETAKFLKQCNEEAMIYADKMEDMARVTGMTTDEVQSFALAAEQAKISNEELEKMLEFANKNGYSTSIDNLERMADQYKSLATPMAKAAYLTERFGKSAYAMGEMFEQGSQGIKKALADIALIPKLADYQIESLGKEKKAMTELGQAWAELKNQIGAGMAVPAAGGANIFAEWVKGVGILVKMTNDLNELNEIGLNSITNKVYELLNNAFGLNIQMIEIKNTTKGINDNVSQTPEKLQAWVSPLDGVKKSIHDTALDMLVIYNHWASIRDKTVVVTIIEQVLQSGMHLAGFTSTGTPVVENEGYKTATRTGHSEGGSFIVPSGYPNDSFYLGAGNFAETGEIITVTPQEKQNQQNQPVQAYVDVRELARAIAEAQQLI